MCAGRCFGTCGCLYAEWKNDKGAGTTAAKAAGRNRGAERERGQYSCKADNGREGCGREKRADGKGVYGDSAQKRKERHADKDEDEDHNRYRCCQSGKQRRAGAKDRA